MSFTDTFEKPFTREHIFSTVTIIEEKEDRKIHKNGIVAINRETKKIDWFYTATNFSTGTNEPKLADDKLYQLDLENNLNIFEKIVDENQV